MRTESKSAHHLLVERLLLRAEPIGEELADAVVQAVPEQWRAQVDHDCRAVTRVIITEAIGCLRDGAAIRPESLAAVHASAADNRAAGVPSTVTVRAMGAALSRFVSVVRREAEQLGRPRSETMAAIATLTARAPIVVFEIITVFVAGHGASGTTNGRHVLHPTAASVLRLTAAGLTVQEVATELGCSAGNVSYHLAELRRRYEVPTTAALTAKAHSILIDDQTPLAS